MTVAVPHARRRVCSALVPLALIAALASSAALRAEPLDPKVELSLSLYDASFDSKVRLDSDVLGLGDRLDLERDLGVDSSSQVLRAEVGFRLGDRFRLDLDHVSFDRSGSNTLSREIQFGDVVYAGNASLEATVKSRHTGASLRFSFVKSPTSDVAVSLGGSWLDVSAALSGIAVATANGVPVGSTIVAEKGEASGPVPLLGLHGAFWLGDRVRLRLDGRYFDLDTFLNGYEGWSGSMTEYGVGADWFVLPWLAVSGGYAGTRIDADFDESDNIGSVKYSFDGFRLGTTFAF
jgi:hypothetical protein